MNDHIDPAIVEKAAKAIDFDQHRYQVNADDWVPRCACGWQGDIPYAVTEHEAHLAALALEAVYADIKAEALDALEAVLNRARLEQDDAECGMRYAAEVNNGAGLAFEQARQQAWSDVERLIGSALGVKS